MIRNITKSMAIALSLLLVAKATYGMEPEPKRLKADTIQQGINASLSLDEKYNIMARQLADWIQQGDIVHVKALLSAVDPKLIAAIINHGTIVNSNRPINEHEALHKTSLMTFALQRLQDLREDIDYKIVQELIKAGGDVNKAGYWEEPNRNQLSHESFLGRALGALGASKVGMMSVNTRLTDFLLENGANPNQIEYLNLSYSDYRFCSPKECVEDAMQECENRLNHGGPKKAPIKTKKIREEIEERLNFLKKLQDKLNYYAEHFDEFQEKRALAFQERVKSHSLAKQRKQLKQIEAERIVAQMPLRPGSFDIEFLKQLERK